MSSFMSSSGPTTGSTVDQASSTFPDSSHHHHHQLHDDVQPPLAVADARFSCSICTEAVIEPVVTHCGHLYCWSCLYRWLEQGMTLQERNELFGNNNVMMMTGRSYNQNPYYDPSKRVCPVCRAPCSVKRVIPIYVRTDISTTGSSATGSTSNSNTATTMPTDTSSSQPLVTDDDILNTVETVMDDENDHDDDVLNVNDENEDVEDDMVVQMVGIDGGGGEEEDFNSALHTTGLRNRSRIRSSISEASTNTTIATTNHHGDEEPEHRHHTNTTTTTATTVPRRPVARSSSNLRLEDRADVAAAAAALALFPTHSRTSPTSTTNTNTNTQPPAHHPASLAHGMLPLVQQAIRHAAMVAGTATPNNTTNTSLIMNDMIPPIHRLEGMRHNNNNINHPTSSSSSPSTTTTTTTSLSNHYGISMMDQPDPTSDFLSWILLLLGIFVLACLILF